MSRATISWHGDRVTRDVRRASARGLQFAGEHVLEESRRLIPIEEGILSDSGHVDSDDSQAAISFDTPYAVRQHEDLTLAHDPGRQAKYLETPLTDEQQVVQRLIASELSKVFR